MSEVVDLIPEQRLTRTTINVLGICCAAEVPIIKRILEPLHGVENVSVNFTARTVTLLHNPLLGDASQFVKVLNEAKMEASIQLREKMGHITYQSFWIAASGVFMAVSFFHNVYSPLEWFAVGAALLGIPRIFLKALASVKRFILDINVLMLLAVFGALALENYTEAGSIVFLFSFADWLQNNTAGKARDALTFAANLAPQNATLATSGLLVALKDISIGTAISVKANEMIPLDGVILSGKTYVNESSVTGESEPSMKNVGDAVWAGTVNLSGYIVLQTIATAEDSALARMIRLVEEAQAKKSHMECIVEKFAKYYTPVVVLVALATSLFPLAFHLGNEREYLYLSLVLVVLACPCALVISTPVTTTCAIVQSAKMGIIVKGGDCLEALGKLRLIAMDKTGTLTEGHFRMLDVFPADESISMLQLLQWILSVESKSVHPIANAVVRYARLHDGQPSQDITTFQIIEGLGVSAVVDGHLVEIGNSRLAFRQNWQIASQATEDYYMKGATICWVGVDGKYVGHFCVADEVRLEACEALQKLKDLGIKPMMLTGDNINSAKLTSMQLENIEYHAELLPNDKVDILQQAMATQGITGMVGDGINDGPALAAADVGFAMGVAGSAIAMETADIALMTNDLRKIAWAVHIGRKHRLKIMQNIFMSVFAKLGVAGLAAFGYAPLWLAVLADVGTCVLVTLNSMQLLLFKATPDVVEQAKSCSIASTSCEGVISNNFNNSSSSTSTGEKVKSNNFDVNYSNVPTTEGKPSEEKAGSGVTCYTEPSKVVPKFETSCKSSCCDSKASTQDNSTELLLPLLMNISES